MVIIATLIIAKKKTLRDWLIQKGGREDGKEKRRQGRKEGRKERRKERNATLILDSRLLVR
jgi:hypothetical protein